jgi:restriction system protein
VVAEITRKRIGELVRTVFTILSQHPDGMRAKELLAKVEQSTTLSDFEKSDYPNRPGVRRFEKTVRFATIAPVKAGWLVKSKGRWILTEDGKKALETYKDPETFAQKAVELYYKWKTAQPKTADEMEVGEQETEETTVTFEEAEELAWSEVETYLRNMNPYDFQKLVAALLRAMGYHISWVSPPGPDKGIDIVAYTDPLGTQNPRIKVQVKRHADAINADGLRSFMALLGAQDVGIYVCTGGFTSTAESEARTQENRRITLIDLERLFDLWVEHYKQLAESDKQLLPLRPVYYLAPAE